MVTPVDAGDPRDRRYRVLGLSALGDVAIGLVLLLYGRSEDNTGLVLAGAILGLAGLAIGTWVVMARDRPQRM